MSLKTHGKIPILRCFIYRPNYTCRMLSSDYNSSRHAIYFYILIFELYYKTHFIFQVTRKFLSNLWVRISGYTHITIETQIEKHHTHTKKIAKKKDRNKKNLFPFSKNHLNGLLTSFVIFPPMSNDPSDVFCRKS